MSLAAAVVGLTLGVTTSGLASDEQEEKIDAVWIDMAGCASDRRDVGIAVDGTLRPLRLAVRWRDASPSEVTAPEELRVVVMAPSARTRQSRILGACIPRSLSPTIWVEYENVLRILGLIPEPRSKNDRSRLALALGRVIAHEVVHVLAPEYGHDESGLLAPWLDEEGLAGSQIGWSPSFVIWFRARHDRANAQRVPVSPHVPSLAPTPAPPPKAHTR
jgi:hypothetical protein